MKHPKPAIREPATKYEAAGLLFAEFLTAIEKGVDHVSIRLVAAQELDRREGVGRESV